MPKLWDESIDGHRRAVRDAITEAAWRLAQEHGPLSLTMSQVAQAAGIGRATLYKYFADIESILVAHHARHIEDHLRVLEELRGGAGSAGSRLVRVVGAYASICFHRGQASPEVAGLVHRGPDVADAMGHLRLVFTELVGEAAAEGSARGDVPPGELAEYCLSALRAGTEAEHPDQVDRLVGVVLDGLGCPPEARDAGRPQPNVIV